jgi:hypothetical protein
MQNSALLQMMTTQTSILEEIKSLRAKDEVTSGMEQLTQPMTSVPTGMNPPADQISMFQGNQHYTSLSTDPTMMQTNAPIQPVDPTCTGKLRRYR